MSSSSIDRLKSVLDARELAKQAAPSAPAPSPKKVTPGQALEQKPVDASAMKLPSGESVSVAPVVTAPKDYVEDPAPYHKTGDPFLIYMDEVSLPSALFRDGLGLITEGILNDDKEIQLTKLERLISVIGGIVFTLLSPIIFLIGGELIRSTKHFGIVKTVTDITDKANSRKKSAVSETVESAAASANLSEVPAPEVDDSAVSTAPKVPKLDLSRVGASSDSGQHSPAAAIPVEELDGDEAHPKPQDLSTHQQSLSAIEEASEEEPAVVSTGPAPAESAESYEQLATFLRADVTLLQVSGISVPASVPAAPVAAPAPAAVSGSAEATVINKVPVAASAPAKPRSRLPNTKGKALIRNKVVAQSGSAPTEIDTAAKTSQITVASIPKIWLKAPKTDEEKAENYVKKVEAEIKHYVKTLVDAYKTISRANRNAKGMLDKDAHDVNDEIRDPIENKLAEALAMYAKSAPNTQAILSLYKLFTNEVHTLTLDTRFVGTKQVDVERVNEFIYKTVIRHIKESNKREDLQTALLEKLKNDFLLTYAKTDAVQAAKDVMSKLLDAKKLGIIDKTVQDNFVNLLAVEFGNVITESLIEDLQNDNITLKQAVEKFLSGLKSPLVADKEMVADKEIEVLGKLQNNADFVNALTGKIADEFIVDISSEDLSKDDIETAVIQVIEKVNKVTNSSGLRLLKVEDARLIRTAILQVFFAIIQDIALDKLRQANGNSPVDIFNDIRSLIQGIRELKPSDEELNLYGAHLATRVEDALVKATVEHVLKERDIVDEQDRLVLTLIKRLSKQGAINEGQFETKVQAGLRIGNEAKRLLEQTKKAVAEAAAKKVADEEKEAAKAAKKARIEELLEKQEQKNVELQRSMFGTWKSVVAEQKKVRERQAALYAEFNAQVATSNTAGAKLSDQINAYTQSVNEGVQIRKQKAAIDRENLTNVKVPLFTDEARSSLALVTIPDGKEGTIVLDIKYSEPREITVREYDAIREVAERLIENIDIRVINESLKNTINSELARQTSKVIEKFQRSRELETELNQINEKNRSKERELEQAVSEFSLMVTNLSDFVHEHGINKKDSFAQDKMEEINAGLSGLQVLLDEVLEEHNKAVPPKAPSTSSSSPSPSSVESAPSLSLASTSPVVTDAQAPDVVAPARAASPTMAAADDSDVESIHDPEDVEQE